MRNPVFLWSGFFVILFVVSLARRASNGSRVPMDINFPHLFAYCRFSCCSGKGLVAALFVWINEGKPGLRLLFGRLIKWRVGLHWYLIVLLLPAVINLIVRQIGSMMGIKIPSLAAPETLLISFATTFVAYLFLNTEELAWRGVALPKLQERFNPHIASLIIGIIWGVFHVPIFLMKGGHPAGFPFSLYMVMVVAMSFIFTWAFNGTGGSLLIVHLYISR